MTTEDRLPITDHGRVLCIWAAWLLLTVAGLANTAALADSGLDLSAVSLEPVYEADFSDPSVNRIVSESGDLFRGGARRPLPADAAWVYEGRDAAWVADGRLWIGGAAQAARRQDGPAEARYHSVLWSTREFPEDFLLTFATVLQAAGEETGFREPAWPAGDDEDEE